MKRCFLILPVFIPLVVVALSSEAIGNDLVSCEAHALLRSEAARVQYNWVMRAGVEGISWIRHIYGPAEYLLFGSPGHAASLLKGGPAGLAEKVSKDVLVELVRMAFRDPEKVSRRIAKAHYDLGLAKYRDNYRLYKRYTKGKPLSTADLDSFINNWYLQAYMVHAKKLFNATSEYGGHRSLEVNRSTLQSAEQELITEISNVYGSSTVIDLRDLLSKATGALSFINNRDSAPESLSGYPPYKDFMRKLGKTNSEFARYWKSVNDGNPVHCTSSSSKGGSTFAKGADTKNKKHRFRRSILFLLDMSGSMAEIPSGSNASKIQQARRALTKTLDKVVESGDLFALWTFGGNCKPQVDFLPFSTERSALETAIGNMIPVGNTPLAKAIENAAEYMKRNAKQNGRIVLLSDGQDTCGGDPVQAAAQLKRTASWGPSSLLIRTAHADQGTTELVVIGFDVSTSTAHQLTRIAHAAHGVYLPATDEQSLASSFIRATGDVLHFSVNPKRPIGGPSSLGPVIVPTLPPGFFDEGTKENGANTILIVLVCVLSFLSMAVVVAIIVIVKRIGASRMQIEPFGVLILEQRGKEVDFPLNRNAVYIGRNKKNDIVLDHNLVSARHAVITHDKQNVLIRDLESSNGTMVNGETVSMRALRPGDVLLFGSIEARFELHGKKDQS